MQVGQEVLQEPDEQVLNVKAGLKSGSQSYRTVLPLVVSLPDIVVFTHSGGLLQLPRRMHSGQVIFQKPETHKLVVSLGMYAGVQLCFRVFASTTSTEVFTHNGVPPHPERGVQSSGQEPSQLPAKQVIDVGDPENPGLQSYA